MKYFIESVHTLNSTGKTKKGALLQVIAQKFVHKVIADDDALTALDNQLRNLVKACNTIYHGKELKISHNRWSGYLSCSPQENATEAIVFAIQYARIGDTMTASMVRASINETLANTARNVQLLFKKGGQK